MERKSLIAPLFKCGNVSETTEVNVDFLSDCARAIRYKRTETVLLADVPPGIARILFVIPITFFVAVVCEYI